MVSNMGYEPPDFFEFEVSPDLHAPSTTSHSNNSGMQSPFAMNSSTSYIPPPFRAVQLSGEDSPVAAALLAAENFKTALLVSAVLSLIFLISKDAHKAFMRRAHWIPCDFLVLSAFSIQLLSLLNVQSETLAFSSSVKKLSIKSETPPSDHPNARWKDILMIHNSRTVLCVFTAYVMPSMADRGLEHSWVRWVALVITVFHHVSSQFYDAKDNIDVPTFLRLWPRPNKDKDVAYYAYATIISLCIILLICILVCATISVRSIERIVERKTSLVLRGEGEFCAGMAEKTGEVHPHPHAHHPPHHHSCWWNVKIDVSRADQHYHLHHVHDHSCLQTVEDVTRVEKEEEIHHCCWRTIEDAAVSGEKAAEEHYRRHCHYCWRTVEDAVLKAWIIVRAYSVQPVLARSALTAAAALILTIQILFTIVGGLSKVLNVKEKYPENGFEIIATVAQCIFIFLGWSLIIFRWATAVAYYQRSEKDSWRSGLQVEDYWTRHLRDMQQAESLDNKIDRLVSRRDITGNIPSVLLSAAIWLQWLLVSFSKACWLASLMIFHNKFISKLVSFMFRKHTLCVSEGYSKYKKILEDVQMLGETPESLWLAHRNSIEKARSLITQGNQDGECNCEDLVDFLSNKKTGNSLGSSCLYPHKPQTGLKFLCTKRSTERTQQPQEASDFQKQQFSDFSTKSWKMTAVSLLSIIVHLSPIYANHDENHCSTPRVVKDCLKAHTQAWEIIDFVEEADTDTEADEVTTEAADMYFHALQNKVDKGNFYEKNFRQATLECLRAALEKLKEECKSNTEPLESVNGKEEREQGRANVSKGNDSMDWNTAASASAVYNLCNSIMFEDGSDVNELLKELESCLADIISQCLEKAQEFLLLTSREWALNRDEKRIGKALYVAGKAKAIMEKLVCNNVAIVYCR
ncbi:hypothetical protein SUGI_0850790 [Cryptomeria japonica]|nr:hypothetical protein SUGI_0850790 [Cryptomeria japonica]